MALLMDLTHLFVSCFSALCMILIPLSVLMLLFNSKLLGGDLLAKTSEGKPSMITEVGDFLLQIVTSSQNGNTFLAKLSSN